MKLNKKGITLVELIVVLVIIILVFLMVVARVNDINDRSEKRAVEADSLTYVKAVNTLTTVNNGSELNPRYEGLYSIEELDSLGIKISGTKPETGFILSLEDKVKYGCLTYRQRKAIIIDNEVVSVGQGSCTLKDGYNKNLKLFVSEYSGKEVAFKIPESGIYLVEAWGAQGGDANSDYLGGYGSYSRGYIELGKDEFIYVNVGGMGQSGCTSTTCVGGYNGGGSGAGVSSVLSGGGGGASSVSFTSGTLQSLLNDDLLSDVIIVAGGGGGASSQSTVSGSGGSGGGYVANNGESNNNSFGPGSGGSSSSIGLSGNTSRGQNGSLGKGGNGTSYSAGGGGGYYGGGASNQCGAGGGSGYIGNELLTDKLMYCYKCREEYDTKVKTFTTDEVSSTPTPYKAKKGHGYVRITLVKSLDSAGNQNKFVFNYKKAFYEFIAPETGNYQLEVWGGQGGHLSNVYYGGYGGYAKGETHLNEGDKLYIYVGGAGTINGAGGYNGGGDSTQFSSGSGGGATSIATVSDPLSGLEQQQDKILIVAGGGGGAKYYENTTSYAATKDYSGSGGSGGGYIGGSGIASNSTVYGIGLGGTQTQGGGAQVILNGNGYNTGLFGQGVSVAGYTGAGSGAGFYGGGTIEHGPAGGGSGYIGNPLLTNKVMYCYNCEESSDVSTKTISTTCRSSKATPNCSKKGVGHAIITLLK